MKERGQVMAGLLCQPPQVCRDSETQRCDHSCLAIPSGTRSPDMDPHHAAPTGRHAEPARAEGDIAHEINAVLHALIITTLILIASLMAGAIITALIA